MAIVELLIGVVAVCAAAALLFILAVALTRSALVGGVLVFLLYTVQAVLVTLPEINLGGRLDLLDVLFGILGSAALLRMTRGVSSLQVLWLLFGALMTAATLRGIQAYGAQPAVADSRLFFYFLAGVLYFSSFELHPRLQSRFTKLFEVAAALLIILAIFRWTATALGLPIVSQWKPITTSPMRVLHAGQALFLSQCAIILIGADLQRAGRRTYIAVLALATVVLVQHRTVWVILAAVAGLSMLSSGRNRSRAVANLLRLSVVGALFVLVVFGGSLDRLTASLTTSAESALAEDSTFSWRVAGWIQLLGRLAAGGFRSIVFGEPFGAGYMRFIDGHFFDYTPHNFYVHVALRLGAVGVLTLLIVYVRTLVRLRAAPSLRSYTMVPGVFQALLVAQLLYFITYAPTYEQSIFFGLALSIASRRGPARVTASTASRPRQWSHEYEIREYRGPNYVL